MAESFEAGRRDGGGQYKVEMPLFTRCAGFKTASPEPGWLLAAIVLGVVAARAVPDPWGHWFYVAGGGLLAGVGLFTARRSVAERIGLLLVGVGFAMFGAGHLAGLSSAVELPAGLGLFLVGLVLLASTR